VRYEANGGGIVEPQRIVDNVCEILERSDRPMKAADLVQELERGSVFVSKSQLNGILYSPAWGRPGLSHDQGFRWSYLRPKATEETGTAVRSAEAQRKQLEELLHFIGFEWEGVHREGAKPIFFFLGEEGENFRVIGPTGRVMLERAELFDAVDRYKPGAFTSAQIISAIMARFKEATEALEGSHREAVRQLVETEFWYECAYRGPPTERITDFIPVDAMILTALLTDEPATLRLGPGAVLEPVYLVVDRLSPPVSDVRHGVFRLGVYELIKQQVAEPFGGELVLTIRREGDRVWLQGSDRQIDLE